MDMRTDCKIIIIIIKQFYTIMKYVYDEKGINHMQWVFTSCYISSGKVSKQILLCINILLLSSSVRELSL